MDLPIDITYDMLPDGGARVTFSTDRGGLSAPLDHDQAIRAAGSILAAAGVREATFTGDGNGCGTIREAAPS